MYVCKIDLKNLGIDESELLDGVEIATLPTIASHMLKRETLMCWKVAREESVWGN